MVTFVTRPDKDDLQLLGDLIEAGTVFPVIDRTYSLRYSRQAMRYLEEGHARGKVSMSI